MMLMSIFSDLTDVNSNLRDRSVRNDSVRTVSVSNLSVRTSVSSALDLRTIKDFVPSKFSVKLDSKKVKTVQLATEIHHL